MMGSKLQKAVCVIALTFSAQTTSAQVLFDETFDNATVIVPGVDLGTNENGIAVRERLPRDREQGLRARPFDPPVTRDDNVLVPRAVVPPAAIGSPPVETGPDGTIQVITDTYRVTGESFKDLWASLQRATLGSALGVGDAKVTFQPRATYNESEGSCAAVDPAVDLTVVLTFPEWDTASSDPEAAAAFGRTLSYLRVHEAQHVLIARGFRKQMVEAISDLPPEPTCEAMQAVIADAAAAVNSLQVAAQRRFDAEERKNSAELFSRAE